MSVPKTAATLLIVIGCMLPSGTYADELNEALNDESPLVVIEGSGTTASRLRRAGCPNIVARWARFSYGPNYCGYFVGGGAAHYGQPPTKLRGEPRYPHEGTWGMDYKPWYSRVRLQWFHGKRKQDGDGQYEPDHLNNPLIPLIFR